MKNKEKFINEIVRVAAEDGNLAIIEGEVLSCTCLPSCDGCRFLPEKYTKGCERMAKEWAEEEYTKEVKANGIL